MINKATNFVLGLYHYSVLLRDTLEYTYVKETYNINAYKARKNALIKSLEDNGQIKVVLSKLGENGPKIEEKLRDFIDLVYSDHSTVIRLSVDELRVDHAQHLAIFEMVVGLHQTIWDLVMGYFSAATTRNEMSLSLAPLLEADERMFRTIVFYSIMIEIEKVFAEFQKVMHESKGEKTPQSHYIISDLSKLVQLINFQKAHHQIKDTAFNDMIDMNMKVLEMIEGKRELPLMPESEVDPETNNVGIMINGVRHYKFADMFRQARNLTRGLLQNAELRWKSEYQPIHNELLERIKEGNDGAVPTTFDA